MGSTRKYQRALAKAAYERVVFFPGWPAANAEGRDGSPKAASERSRRDASGRHPRIGVALAAFTSLTH